MRYFVKTMSIVGLLSISQIAYSGEILDTYVDGDTLTATLMNNIKAAVNDNDSRINSLDRNSLDAADGSPADAVFVNNNGTVGIGTTSPQAFAPDRATLHIQSNLTPTIFLEELSKAERWEIFVSAFHGGLLIRNPDITRFSVLPTGQVGIGTSSPSLTLQVNGSAGGTSAYQVISDTKYKKAVLPIEGALAKVGQLRGVTYDWRQDDFPDMNFKQGRQVGLIAQEVESVIPEVVSVDVNSTYSLEYSALVPVLIEAIKEQQAMIDQLKLEVEALSR